MKTSGRKVHGPKLLILGYADLSRNSGSRLSVPICAIRDIAVRFLIKVRDFSTPPEMTDATDQRLLARLRKKLSVARLGEAQIFLGIFVIGVKAQRFTELNNGL